MQPQPRESVEWAVEDGYATAGYPVHRVTRWRQWTNPHLAVFTDVEATCGWSDTRSGSYWSVLGNVSTARRLELCRKCWSNGHPLQHR